VIRDPNASLSLARFFGQSRDWRPSSVEAASHALIREGQDVAATLNDDPLRGDPDCPTVRRLVALLHRRRTRRRGTGVRAGLRLRTVARGAVRCERHAVVGRRPGDPSRSRGRRQR